ncbi:MAG: hypothetical protein C0524_17235 [Rhodobacter sp.]|nr:hypothetical protein [Rhodobacter sp.]
MSPAHRKILYAVSFETLGTLVASLGLLAMTDASAGSSFLVSVIGATVALCWSYLFNTLFEAWEKRQATKGRSFRRRTIHAVLFEGGMVVLFVPFMAWWLGVSLIEAAIYEAGLILIFIVYTYVFTWGFDRIFGLPVSAR